jgi:hypothetical protein
MLSWCSGVHANLLSLLTTNFTLIRMHVHFVSWIDWSYIGVLQGSSYTINSLAHLGILPWYINPFSWDFHSSYHSVCWYVGMGMVGIAALILCGGKQNGGTIPVNKNLWSLSFVFCQSSLGNSFTVATRWSS